MKDKDRRNGVLCQRLTGPASVESVPTAWGNESILSGGTAHLRRGRNERARTGNCISAVFARGVRPLLIRLATLQDPTQSLLTARSCGNIAGLALTPRVPGHCSRSRRRESAPDARIGSRLVRGVGVRSPGIRPGFAPGADPGDRRLLEAAAGWPRRSGQRNGPCSVSPASPARSWRLCPAVRGSRPLGARSAPCHRGISGP